MNIAHTLLIACPAAVVCAWLTGWSNNRRNQSKVPVRLRRDYFKGLNYLINEEPDKAVDVFVKLLEVDSDTVETHFALGGLYRRKGEVSRAIRIHQNLIARPQLSKAHRIAALSALGEDYLKAGVLDRAEAIFLDLMNQNAITSKELYFLLHIYQQEKDWDNATKVAQKLAVVTGKSHRSYIAHYYCELYQQCREDEQKSKNAMHYLKKAESIDRHCIRVFIYQIEQAINDKRYAHAINYADKLIKEDPSYLSEIIDSLVASYRHTHKLPQLKNYLENLLKKTPQLSVALCLSEHFQSSLTQDESKSLELYLIDHPSLEGLYQLLNLITHTPADNTVLLATIKQIVGQIKKGSSQYSCEKCGFSAKSLFWLCPSCNSWSTMKPTIDMEK